MPKEEYTKTIRRMLLLRMFLLPSLVLLLVCGSLIYFFASYSSRQVKNELVRIATGHRNLIDRFLAEKSAMLQFITRSFHIKTLREGNTLEILLRNLQATSGAFSDLGLFDQNGNHLAYAGPYDLAGKNYAHTEWFQAIQEKGVYISDEFLGFRNIPHFIIAVKHQENESIWYLRATIDTDYFNDLVENIRIGKTGEAYLVNRNGVLQTRRRSGGNIMERDTDYADYLIKPKESTYFTGKGGALERRVYAAVPLWQTDWVMIARQAQTDAYAPLAFSMIVALVILTTGGPVFVLTGFYMASNLAARLKLADMEKQEMKTQLIFAGKMAEIGEMSTGIAHEINNPLQIMKSELAMIKSVSAELESVLGAVPQAEIWAEIKDSTNEIDLQIDRCSKITQGLLGLARKSDQVIQPINLCDFVSRMVQMVDQRASVENIRIVQQIEANLPEIKTDSNQLQQVFLNLFNNAFYALKGRWEAQICIRIFKDDPDVVIQFSDNGCGFTPENMAKAFVPFFTTKPVGQGTGLGLSTVYRIIKGLGGEITLMSEMNAGSVFSIRLPLHATMHSAAI